jgi:hypothetical protein
MLTIKNEQKVEDININLLIGPIGNCESYNYVIYLVFLTVYFMYSV